MSDVEALPPVSRKRTALINLAFNYSGLVFMLTQAIVLVPLYLQNISAALFGGWLAVGNVIAWVELADPGISSVLQQRLAAAYGAGESRRISRIIGTGIAISSVLALVPFLLWPVAHHVGPFLRLSTDDSLVLADTFKLSLVALALTLASYAPTAANLGLQRAVTPGVINFSSSVVALTVMITLLVTGHGLPSLPLGMIARASILYVGNLVTVVLWSRRHLSQSPCFDREELRAVLAISTFTFTSRMGGALLGRLDSVMVSRLLNPESATVLALTTRTYDPVRMVGERVGPALMPTLSHLGGEAGSANVARLTARLVSVIGWIGAIGVGGVMALNEPFVALWVGSEFFGGQGLTAAAGATLVLSILLSLVGHSVFAMGGIRKTAFIGLIEAGVKLPLQFLLTPILGLIAMPLCSLGASIAVGAWWLPREAATLAGTTLWQEQRPIVHAALRALVLGSVGWAMGLQLQSLVAKWTWPLFITATCLVALILVSILCVIDATLRATLLSGLRRLLRGTPQTEA